MPYVPFGSVVFVSDFPAGEVATKLTLFKEEESAASQWTVVVSPIIGFCVVKPKPVIFGGPGEIVLGVGT